MSPRCSRRVPWPGARPCPSGPARGLRPVTHHDVDVTRGHGVVEHPGQVGRVLRQEFDEHVVVPKVVQRLSFRAIGTPASGPLRFPWSTAFACIIA